MARIWRDVLSANEFGAMIGDRSYVNKSTAKWKFGTSRSSVLKSIHGCLVEYHKLRKRDLNNVPRRQEYLESISQYAEMYLHDFKVNMQTASARSTREASLLSDLVRRKQTEAKEESLDRNILTLKRRALRKKAYLGMLKNYCESSQAGDFIKYVRKEAAQDTSGGLLGIHKSNLAESEDFAHREGFSHGALLTAFEEWVVSTSFTMARVHFFLWLEDHPICLTQDRTSSEYQDVMHVRYHNYQEPQSIPNEAKFHILVEDNSLLINETGAVMDTYQEGYKTETRKAVSPKNSWANGLAAFVWAPSGELFIGQHYAGKFHHSSLRAGGKVKCAGMIGIRAGKIEELSNNSGHYKPSLDHMKRIVRFFQSCFNQDHHIVVTTGPNTGIEGKIDTILA